MAKRKLKAWTVTGFPVELFVQARTKKRAKELMIRKLRQHIRMKELM